MIRHNNHSRHRGAKTIFETSRLLARELSPEDAPLLYALNKDREVLQYTGDQPFGSVEEALRFLQGYRDYERYGCGRWALEHKETGDFLGWCGLKVHDGEWVDLGFRLMKACWNQGYATEAARASLQLGFAELGFPRVIGRAATANTASVRVLEKAGMRFWKSEPVEGIPSAVIYRITREEFLRKGR